MSDYFNLIVGFGTQSAGGVRMEASRFFEVGDQEAIDRFSASNGPLLGDLQGLPCLFLPEAYGCSERNTKVGFVSNMRMMGRDVIFDVRYDDSFAPLDCNWIWANRDALGINFGGPHDFQRSRSNWTVVRGNLYELLLRHLPIRRFGGGILNIPATDTTEDDLVVR